MDKASGVMIWQLLGDARGKKSLLKSIGRKAKSKISKPGNYATK